MNLQTAFLLIYAIVFILIFGFSFLVHERWKEDDALTGYCGRFLRLVLGLLSWINAFVIFPTSCNFSGANSTSRILF